MIRSLAFEVEAIIVSFFVKAIGLLLMPPLLFVSLWVPEELSFSSTSITIFLLCVALFLVMGCIILLNYLRQLYSNKTQAKFIPECISIMQQTTVILLLISPPLLPMIKHYTLSNSDNVIVSQQKEKLVSLKKYQYVLLVRLQSKWNKSCLHHVERRTHRHGFGWRWWVENKAFFEQILISNIHGLAAFFYDWTTESLFVCVMKHIEGYVPKLKWGCVCVCTH